MCLPSQKVLLTYVDQKIPSPFMLPHWEVGCLYRHLSVGAKGYKFPPPTVSTNKSVVLIQECLSKGCVVNLLL